MCYFKTKPKELEKVISFRQQVVFTRPFSHWISRVLHHSFLIICGLQWHVPGLELEWGTSLGTILWEACLQRVCPLTGDDNSDSAAFYGYSESQSICEWRRLIGWKARNILFYYYFICSFQFYNKHVPLIIQILVFHYNFVNMCFSFCGFAQSPRPFRVANNSKLMVFNLGVITGLIAGA